MLYRLGTVPLVLALSVTTLFGGDAVFGILNGSFEDIQQGGPTRTTITQASNWSAEGGFMLLEQGVNGTSGIAALDGTQFVSFGHNGAQNDKLFQTVSTDFGVEYQVDYSLVSIQGNGATQAMRISAFDDDTDTMLAFAETFAPTTNGQWIQANPLTFVAVSPNTRIEFEHVLGSGISNVAIDRVLFVPEPSTYILMGLGLAVVTVISRRKR